jgi:hypothetical protein
MNLQIKIKMINIRAVLAIAALFLPKFVFMREINNE